MASYAEDLMSTHSMADARVFASLNHQKQLGLARATVAMVLLIISCYVHPCYRAFPPYVLITCVAPLSICSWFWGGGQHLDAKRSFEVEVRVRRG